MDPLLIVLFISLGGFLVFALYMAISNEIDKSKSSKKVKEYRKNTGSTSIIEINRMISNVYNDVFSSENSGISIKGKIRALEYKAQEIADIACEMNILDNKINGIADSSSNLGMCGVSATHFYYQINSLVPKFASIFPFGNDFGHQMLLHHYESFMEGIASNSRNSYDILNWENDKNAVMRLLPLYRDLCKCKNPFSSFRISLSDICCYRVDGDVQYVSNVHGGGVNLQGAVAGAVLAGGAAAIIGSQVGTEIRTTIDKVDTRHIFLVYRKDGKIISHDVESNNTEHTLTILKDLIPQKEESLVKLENQQNTQVKSFPTSKTDEIKEYKELLDLGIISQEEFDTKKKQLLDL